MLEGETITDGFRSERGARGARPLPVLQGLQGRLPGQRRHGDLQGRVPLPPLQAPPAPARRLLDGADHVPRAARPHAPAAGQPADPRRPGSRPRWSSAPAGSAPSGEMPPFAQQTFKDWFAERGAVNPDGDPVVLFPDTFNNFLHPEPMKAAARGARGGRVPGRRARSRRCAAGARSTTTGCSTPRSGSGGGCSTRCAPHIREGVPVVGVEPSCVAAFRDELPNLMPARRGRQAAVAADADPGRVPAAARARLGPAAARSGGRSSTATAIRRR